MKKVINILIILLVLASLILLEKETRDVFFSLLERVPVMSQATVNLENVLDYFKSADRLRQERDILREENSLLTSRLASMNQLRAENEELRTALKAGLSEERELISSHIILKRFSEGLLIIDKGQEDGVHSGSSVTDSRQGLVGRVVEVYRSSSIISLAAGSDTFFAVRVSGKEGVARAAGTGDGFHLDTVRADQPVGTGDLIITSGVDGVFAADLVVGQVVSVESSDTNPFQEAKVDPFVDVAQTNHVFVIGMPGL